ncbi:probable cyclin-dependent serine/threonine-protein kinase DDB_G0292550 [Condylostylus longicornis]|uniref:probable cyclin-dependent serine/threonine-protein kinase DDB_G0292550 n=1 Tax=Condylostylus longicornis TaxID=2530218 RepID=UPI00244E5268|nr:probable cyclin-dependent serine/threonine-protein kinase DDB_G0292550 [Condylostylus longicornis]XP_055381665.1 probable cyclin-dependent serine/threonine-protein kinase DDB_G0292550 [Condylostylus longicornis]
MHNTYCQSRNYINCCYNNPIYPPNENAVSNNNQHNNINKANTNCNNVNYYPSIPAPTGINNINRQNSKEIFYPWSYNHVTTTPAVQAANGIPVNEKCYSYNYNNYNHYNNNYDYNNNINKCDYANISTPQTSNCTPKASYDYKYQWPLNNNCKNNYSSYQHQQNTVTPNSNSSTAPPAAHYNYENRLHENAFINSHQSTILPPAPPPTHQTAFHHPQTNNSIQSNSRLKQSSNSTTLDYYQPDNSKTFVNSNLTHHTYYKQCFVPRYSEPNPHKNSISIRNPFEYPDESCGTKTVNPESINYDTYKKSQVNLINYETYKKSAVEFPINYGEIGYRKNNSETSAIAWNANYINELPNNITTSNTDITRHQRYISQENVWIDKRYINCPNFSTTATNYQINNKIIGESSSNCAFESRHINPANYSNSESIVDPLPTEFPLNDFYSHHHQQHVDFYNINNQLLQTNINASYEYERFNVPENNNSKESLICGQAIRDFISNWNEEEDEDASLQTIEVPDAILINKNNNEKHENNLKVKDQIKEEVITEEEKEKNTLLKIEKIENEDIKTELIENEKELNDIEKNSNSEIIKSSDQDSASITIKNSEIKSKTNIKKIRRNQKRNKSFQSNLRKERYKIIRKIYKIKCFYTKYILPKNKFLYKKVPLSKRSTNLIKNSKTNRKKPNYADYKTIKRTYKKRLQKLRSKNKAVSNANLKSEPDIKENNTNNRIIDDNHDSNSTKSDIPSLIDICEQFIINETIKSGCNLNVYLYEAYNYNNNNNFDESDCSNDDNNIEESLNTTTPTTTETNLEETNKSCTTTKTCNDNNIIDTIENNENNISSSQNLEKNENKSVSTPTTSNINYIDSNSNVIIDDNSQIINSNSNSSSPPPSLSIHHEEIVAENTQKFHLEKFAKDLRTKYLNKCNMKNYFISKLYKRYKWRTKF